MTNFTYEQISASTESWICVQLIVDLSSSEKLTMLTSQLGSLADEVGQMNKIGLGTMARRD